VIRALSRLLALALLELALTCLMAGGLLLFCAWRFTRRLVTDQPDRLERGGIGAAQLLQLAAAFAASRASVDSPEPELAPEAEQTEDWRRLVI
jgi:hypothetical protein